MIADLTRIMIGEGVLWLASIRDAFSNKVVGWGTDARVDTDLLLATLNHALRSRDVHDGLLVHHSDKGCQCTALRFTQWLADAGIACSTGSVGDSFDNALAENLWSTIKTELLYWAVTEVATRAEAESALLRYIDGWYNPRRIQEGLGGLGTRRVQKYGTVNTTQLASIPSRRHPDNQVSGKVGEPHGDLPEHRGQPTLMVTLDPRVRHLLGINHPLLALFTGRPQIQILVQLPHQLPTTNGQPLLQLCVRPLVHVWRGQLRHHLLKQRLRPLEPRLRVP